MSNNGNTQTIHIIGGEEYVLLRDEARSKLVTPKDLLKFLRELANLRCYRKIKGKYVSVYVYADDELPFDLRNSLLVPRQLSAMVPRIPRLEVHTAFHEYYFARAEQMSALDQLKAAPRYKTVRDPEYLTYLKAYVRKHHADEDLQKAEAVLEFILRQCAGEGDFIRLSRLFFAALVAHAEATEAAEQAAFNASYYGMDYPEDREHLEEESNQAARDEENAYNRLVAVTREYGNLLVKLRVFELNVFGETLLAELTLRQTRQALSLIDWNDDAGFERANQSFKRAEKIESTTRKEFLGWWGPQISQQRLAMHTERMDAMNKEAEGIFASAAGNNLDD